MSPKSSVVYAAQKYSQDRLRQQSFRENEWQGHDSAVAQMSRHPKRKASCRIAPSIQAQEAHAPTGRYGLRTTVQDPVSAALVHVIGKLYRIKDDTRSLPLSHISLMDYARHGVYDRAEGID